LADSEALQRFFPAFCPAKALNKKKAVRAQPAIID